MYNFEILVLLLHYISEGDIILHYICMTTILTGCFADLLLLVIEYFHIVVWKLETEVRDLNTEYFFHHCLKDRLCFLPFQSVANVKLII